MAQKNFPVYSNYSSFEGFINEKDIYDYIKSNPQAKIHTDYVLKTWGEALSKGWEGFNKKDYQAYKKEHFLASCISCNVNRIGLKKRSVKYHTGLVNLDLDHPDEKEALLKFWKEKENYPFIRACWRSVSGSITGAMSVVVSVEIPSEGDSNRVNQAYSFRLRDLFSKIGITVGSASDFMRIRILSYDEAIYVNEDSEQLAWEGFIDKEKVARRRTFSSKDVGKILNDFELDARSEETNDIDLITLRRFFKAVIDRGLPVTTSFESFLKVGFLCTLDEELGRSFFHKIAQLSPKYDQHISNSEYSKLLQSDYSGKRITSKSMAWIMGDIVTSESIRINFDESVFLEDDHYVSDTLVLNHARVLISSPPNSGKTRAMLDQEKSIINTNGVIYTAPTIAMAEQKGEQYGLEVVCQGNQFNQHVDRYSCTYDSLERVVSNLLFNGYDLSDITLVVDEAHQIVESYSFRRSAINSLIANMELFENIIMLSGTPFPLNGWSFLNDFHVIDTYRNEKRKPFSYLNYTHNSFFAMMEHREDRDTKGKTDFIYINDRKRAEKYAIALRQMYNLKVCVFHSLSENEEDKQKLRNFGMIEDYDVVITTSFLSEGVDINKCNVGCVYVFSYNSIVELIQFKHRFRDKIPESIIIMRLSDRAERKKKERPVCYSSILHKKWITEDAEKVRLAIQDFDYEDIKNTVIKDRNSIVRKESLSEIGILSEQCRRLSRACFRSQGIMSSVLKSFGMSRQDDLEISGIVDKSMSSKFEALCKQFNKDRKSDKKIMATLYYKEIKFDRLKKSKIVKFLNSKRDAFGVSNEFALIVEDCGYDLVSAYRLLIDCYDGKVTFSELRNKLAFELSNMRLVNQDHVYNGFISENEVETQDGEIKQLMTDLFPDKTYTSTEICEKINSHDKLRPLLLRCGRTKVTKTMATKFFKRVFKVTDLGQIWNEGKRDRKYAIIRANHFDGLKTLRKHLIQKRNNVEIVEEKTFQQETRAIKYAVHSP